MRKAVGHPTAFPQKRLKSSGANIRQRRETCWPEHRSWLADISRAKRPDDKNDFIGSTGLPGTSVP